jgi:hypothetical protein
LKNKRSNIICSENSEFAFVLLFRILGSHIKSGVVSVPFGIRSSLESSGQTDQILPADSPIKVMEGAKDNLPDPSSLEAAKEIANLVSSLTEHDLLFVLVTKLLTATSFKDSQSPPFCMQCFESFLL